MAASLSDLIDYEPYLSYLVAWLSVMPFYLLPGIVLHFDLDVLY